MANKVFLHQDGYVEIIVDGDQTVESIEAMAHRAFELCREQKQANRSAVILDNICAIGVVAPEGRKAVVNLIKSGEFDRFAMFGKGGLLKLGANLMLNATGKGRRVKYFDDRAGAIAWLRAVPPS